VLWDEKHQTIFAARDRAGIKPLFYAFHQETLYLASEVKALFAADSSAANNRVGRQWPCIIACAIAYCLSPL
jgi:asparagine synthetase B (glutamine-hydrolysing)